MTGRCGRCGEDLDVQSGEDRRCPRCGTPHSRQDLSPEKFPLTLQLVSGTTNEVVWSRVVTLAEARSLAHVEIPSYVGTAHYPVRVEIQYADGTTDVGGMQ